jgi:16S rRNA (uracil1498-N3)-methyltransferase
MKLHRYYLPDTDLTHDFWMDDLRLFHQWTRVLRYEVGREVELFNDKLEDKLYKIIKFGDKAVHLELVTELESKVPESDLYLCFAMLKKDKIEWVLQKGTELGARHFIPMLTDRTEKTGFDIERAEKIVIEASEQCGRSDIPRVREPMKLETVINELSEKVVVYVAEQGSPELSKVEGRKSKGTAVLIGPEGGWSDTEKQLFKDKNLHHIALSNFTLRAETACITGSALCMM